jgi:putative ABC transport system ATP-binding protein
MLTLENIDITLGKNTKRERKVLQGLNLTVAPGEFLVLLGGNGTGKSTLFNVIAGGLKPDAGKLCIDGQDVTAMSQAQRAQAVSKVMQDPMQGTIAQMSILENMAFAYQRGQKRGLSLYDSQARRELFQDKLRLLGIGLEKRMHDQVSGLSGGQRQALSMIMAILQPTKILLLDEITAALDPASTIAVMDLANRIVREQRLTCVMITHDMAHAIQYGDRLVWLKDGQCIKSIDAATKAKMTPAELMQVFSGI